MRNQGWAIAASSSSGAEFSPHQMHYQGQSGLFSRSNQTTSSVEFWARHRRTFHQVNSPSSGPWVRFPYPTLTQSVACSASVGRDGRGVRKPTGAPDTAPVVSIDEIHLGSEEWGVHGDDAYVARCDLHHIRLKSAPERLAELVSESRPMWQTVSGGLAHLLEWDPPLLAEGHSSGDARTAARFGVAI